MEHLDGRIINIQSEIRDNINWLNCGGCGVFALMLIEELEKYGVAAEILIVDDEALEDRKAYIDAEMNGKP